MQSSKNRLQGNDKTDQSDQESKSNNQNRKDVIAAQEQADSDIKKDADLNINDPNDDLDEGETARLGEGENPIT